VSAKRIVVVGSANTDQIIKLERLPRPGETILGGDFLTAAGGKGANQAVGAARAGGRVTFVGRVGADAFGARAIAGLRRDHIDTRYVIRDPRAASGTALILLDGEGRNMIAVAAGANGRLSQTDVHSAAPAIRSAAVVLLQLESPLQSVVAAAELAFKSGARVILNPAPARPLPDRLLRHVSILTPNETEAELLSGIRITGNATAKRAAEKLRQRGVSTVVITLGARGAFVVTDGLSRHVTGFRVRPVDTTAAGDIFNGALAVALAEQQPLLDAVRFANAAAAMSVTRLGAQPSAPTRPEIERMLAAAVSRP
jgi:ribokinase